jgi:hypothetical protein
MDNGNALATPFAVAIRSGGTTIDIYKDNVNTAWTASGTKRVEFNTYYEM